MEGEPVRGEAVTMERAPATNLGALGTGTEHPDDAGRIT